MEAPPRRRPAASLAYNRLVEHALLPLGDLVLRTELMGTLRAWRRIQDLTAPQLQALQDRNLGRLLRHAAAEVPYYRGLGVTPDEDPQVWLRRFPILTKQVLRAEGERLRTPGVDAIAVSSSGSSGVQSTVWVTRREVSRSQAIQTLWWEWAGYRLGDRLLQTGITPDRGVVKRAKDLFLRTDYVVAFGLTDDEMAAALEGFRGRRWGHLGGYASSLDALATVARDRGLDDVRFDSVISWGDKVFDHHRRRIEARFGARIHDTYGTSEGIYVAAQHSGSDYLVMSPHVVVELLDERWEPVAPGEIGRVVVTGLDGFAMPLVRYYLGDLAVAPVEPAAVAGEPAFPRLERIVGRDTDTVRTPGGRLLTVHTFTGVFEHAPEIEQFAVTPEPDGLRIDYLPGPGCDDGVLDRVLDQLRTQVGEPLAVTWVRVDHIAPTPSGKPQIIRPTVDRAGGDERTVGSGAAPARDEPGGRR